MNQSKLENELALLPLGRIRYFETVGSTNDVAGEWVAEGVPDLSLAVADEQTRGRGRSGRQWFTPSGAAIAFSLVLHPLELKGAEETARVTGLGAVAVCQALEETLGLNPQIKWPNDVLLAGKKVGGILAEAHWQGHQLLAFILGIGINVAPLSVPPTSSLNYPAACLEDILGMKINRLELIRNIIGNVITWRAQLPSLKFIIAWENRLAFRNQIMLITPDGGASYQAKIVGLDPSGRLKLLLPSGKEFAISASEIQIHPLIDSSENKNTLI